MPWSGQGEPLRAFRAKGCGRRLQRKRDCTKEVMGRSDSRHMAGLRSSGVVRMADATVQVCPGCIRLLRRIETDLVRGPYGKWILLRLQDLKTMQIGNMRGAACVLMHVRGHCRPAKLQRQQRDEQSEQFETHSKIVVALPENLHCKCLCPMQNMAEIAQTKIPG